MRHQIEAELKANNLVSQNVIPRIQDLGAGKEMTEGYSPEKKQKPLLQKALLYDKDTITGRNQDVSDIAMLKKTVREKTMKQANKRKGYSYSVSWQAILAWQKVPAAQKLQWLEEANLFIRKAAPRSVQKMQRLLRAGLV